MNRGGYKMKHYYKKIIVLLFCFNFFFVSLTTVGLLNQSSGGTSTDLILSDLIGDSAYSKTIAEEDGDIHIVWHDDRSGNYEIYYNKIIEERYVVALNDSQITYHSGDSMYPTMAIDKLGNIHLTWQDYRDGNWEIYYKKLDNSGAGITNDERVTYNPSNSIRPSISVDNDTNTHVTWYDDRTGNYEIYWDKRVEPDITPTKIETYPDDIYEDDLVTIEVTVENIGDNYASNISVEFLLDNITNDIQIINLSSQSSEIIMFNMIAGFGLQEILINVDSENKIIESNEQNNNAAEYITCYRISEFSNSSIPAYVTLDHSVEIDVTIENVPDPIISGTQNNVGLFVEYISTDFFKNAQIRIEYNEEQLGETPESSLKMYYWDIYDYNGEQWVCIEDSGVNTIEDYVWANVSHLCIFAPLSTGQIVCGDADGSGGVDIDDVVYLINYIFSGGPEPVPDVCVGDADGSGGVDIDDVVYLISYIFSGVPEPVDDCCG